MKAVTRSHPVHLGGTRPLGSRKGLTGKHIIESKGPVETMDIAGGIDAPQQNVAAGFVAHKKNLGCGEVKSVCQHHPKEPAMHLYSIIPSHHRQVYLLFISRPIKRAQHRPQKMQSQKCCQCKALQRSHFVTDCPAYLISLLPILSFSFRLCP